MSGIVVKDESTVVVTLSTPDPIFDQKIATALIAPVKISLAEDENGNERQEWWTPKNGVVVSGPFMPETMDLDGGVITLVPNPNFFGPTPKLDKIVITTVADPSTATLMLKTGKMDAHTELITPTIVQDLGADFISGPPLAKGQQFWFDAHKPPMDDINVRKALIMAINKDELAVAAYPDGPFTPATQILNKVPGVDPDFEDYPYDPEAAKAALAASKYKDAKFLPKIMFVGISTPTHEAAAQYIAEQWRTILGITGIEMKPAIETYSGPDQASVQIFRDDVGTRVPDAVSYLMGAIHTNSGNARNKMGGYSNPEIDALLEQASGKGVKDPARIELAQQAQNIFRDEYMFIPYYYDVMSKWAMPWVNGFEKNDDWQVIEPWNVTIDESKKPQ
jgi:peptide/nickel transport system substrate-binding protein